MGQELGPIERTRQEMSASQQRRLSPATPEYVARLAADQRTLRCGHSRCPGGLGTFYAGGVGVINVAPGMAEDLDRDGLPRRPRRFGFRERELRLIAKGIPGVGHAPVDRRLRTGRAPHNLGDRRARPDPSTGTFPLTIPPTEVLPKRLGGNADPIVEIRCPVCNRVSRADIPAMARAAWKRSGKPVPEAFATAWAKASAMGPIQTRSDP